MYLDGMVGFSLDLLSDNITHKEGPALIYLSPLKRYNCALNPPLSQNHKVLHHAFHLFPHKSLHVL